MSEEIKKAMVEIIEDYNDLLLNHPEKIFGIQKPATPQGSMPEITHAGIRQDLIRRAGVYISSGLATKEDFETAYDTLNKNSRDSSVSYYIQCVESQYPNERKYVEFEGCHYMLFKNRWWNYIQKTGFLREIEKPEWAVKLIEKYPDTIINFI